MPVVASKVAEIDGLDGGVRYTPRQDQSDPGLPLTLGEFPIVLIVPSAGIDLSYASGAVLADHTMVTLSLYVAQGFLPEAVDVAIGFIEPMKKKLAQNYHMDETLEHFRPLTPWWEGPSGLEYASQLYTGINFYFQAKENHDDPGILLDG